MSEETLVLIQYHKDRVVSPAYAAPVMTPRGLTCEVDCAVGILARTRGVDYHLIQEMLLTFLSHVNWAEIANIFPEDAE